MQYFAAAHNLLTSSTATQDFMSQKITSKELDARKFPASHRRKQSDYERWPTPSGLIIVIVVFFLLLRLSLSSLLCCCCCHRYYFEYLWIVIDTILVKTTSKATYKSHFLSNLLLFCTHHVVDRTCFNLWSCKRWWSAMKTTTGKNWREWVILS